MKMMLKIVAGVVVGGIVLIVAASALFTAGVKQERKQSDKTAITLTQYESMKTGITKRALIAHLGNPKSSDDTQVAPTKGLPGSGFRQSCLYYARKGSLLSSFQFCFDGSGRLTDKSSI